MGTKKLEKAGKAREGAIRSPLLLIKSIALVSGTLDSFGGSLLRNFFLMTVGNGAIGCEK